MFTLEIGLHDVAIIKENGIYLTQIIFIIEINLYFVCRSGDYRLVYYSADSKDILGVSPPFHAR